MWNEQSESERGVLTADTVVKPRLAPLRPIPRPLPTKRFLPPRTAFRRDWCLKHLLSTTGAAAAMGLAAASSSDGKSHGSSTTQKTPVSVGRKRNARTSQVTWRGTDETGEPIRYKVTIGTDEKHLDIVGLSKLEADCQRAAYAESSLFAAMAGVGMDVSEKERFGLADRFVEAFYSGKGETLVKRSGIWWSAALLGQQLGSLSLSTYPEARLGVYGGKFLRTLKRLILPTSQKWDKRFRFAQAFLMAKRACDAVDDAFVDEETEKHKERLTSPPVPTPHDPRWLIAELRRTVGEVFVQGRERWQPENHIKTPSERAHFHKGLGEGGALGWLLWRRQGVKDITRPFVKRPKFEQDFRQTDPSVSISLASCRDGLPELVSMLWRPSARLAVEIRGFNDWIVDRLAEAFDGFRIDDEVPDCAPSPVLEACKVRMITKGPERLQFLGRYLQTFLWSSLRKHPVFRLIGQPISHDDILRIMNNTPKGSWWLSGDYQAATDYISSWASDACWQAICDVCLLPEFWRKLGVKILTDHRIHYPDGSVVQQRNGQLMGSVISFPILCLVNATVNRLAMEQAYGREFSLSQTEMLINGDDCLLHLPAGSYDTWKCLTRSVGLRMSPGKNYFSDKFVVINSRMFVPNGPLTALEQDHFVSKIPFLSPGNLHGVGRVLTRGDDDGEDSQTGFLDRCHSLLSEAPPAIRDELIDLWLYLNANRLKAISSKAQSWFLPRFCGGLGVPNPCTFEWSSVSTTARRVMRYVCGLTGDVMKYSLALENAGSSDYVKRGCSVLARWHEALGLQARLVPQTQKELYQIRGERSEAFTQFCLWQGAKSSCKLSTVFTKLAVKAAKVEPADGMPSFERCVLRSSIAVTQPRVRWEELCRFDRF